MAIMAVHSAVTTDSSSTGGSSSVNRAIRNAIRSDGDTTKFLRADWKFAVPTGGGGNGVDVTVDFGSSFTHYAETVVTGETWVTSTSKIVATPKASDGSGIEAAILSFQPCVGEPRQRRRLHTPRLHARRGEGHIQSLAWESKWPESNLGTAPQPSAEMTVDTNGNAHVTLPTTESQAGFACITAENDDGTVLGSRHLQPIEVSNDYRLRAGVDPSCFTIRLRARTLPATASNRTTRRQPRRRPRAS